MIAGTGAGPAASSAWAPVDLRLHRDALGGGVPALEGTAKQRRARLAEVRPGGDQPTVAALEAQLEVGDRDIGQVAERVAERWAEHERADHLQRQRAAEVDSQTGKELSRKRRRDHDGAVERAGKERRARGPGSDLRGRRAGRRVGPEPG